MLDSVSPALPALMEAFQVTTKVARVGFDWPRASEVLESSRRSRRSSAGGRADGRCRSAWPTAGRPPVHGGDVARLLGHDPESTLKAANRKFRRRFRHIEERLRQQGRKPADANLQEMEALWQDAKRREAESRARVPVAPRDR